MEIQFRILGPLELVVGGQPVSVTGRQQRLLLGVLVARAGRAISADELIDHVWGAEAPPTVRAALHVHLSRLRRLLAESRGPLVRRPDGYVLELAPGAVDADRFEELASLGRDALAAGDATEASRSLRAGLALWRGPAFADLGEEPALAQDARRLNDARVRALEDRIEADLQLGRAADALPELERLALEHPYRERLRAQLMQALYACGRLAEALEAYRTFDRLLREELGLEASPELKALHGRLLAHRVEPRTPAPTEPARVPTVRAVEPETALEPAPDTEGREPRWRVAGLVSAAALVAAVVIGVGISRHGTSAEARTTPLPANAVAALDPDGLRTRFVARVGGRPAGLAVARDAAWVGSPDNDTLLHVDIPTRTVRRFGVHLAPGAIAATAAGAWLVDERQQRLVHVDANSPTTPREIDVPVFEGQDPIRGVVVAAGAAWYAQSTTPFVHRVGGLSNTATDSVRLASADTEVDGAGYAAIGTDGRTLWASYEVLAGYAVGVGGGEPVTYIAQIDPVDGRVVSRTRLAGRPTAVAVDEESVWVAVPDDDHVWRLDKRTGTPEQEIDVAGGPIAVASGAGAVWVITARTNDLVRIDRDSAKVTQRVDLGVRPVAVATGSGLVWVAVASRGRPG